MARFLLLVLAMMLLTTPAARGQKLSQLTEDTAPTSDDIMETTNSPGGTPASRKVTLANLPKALLQSIANGHLLYNNNGVFGSPTITTPLAATNGTVSVAGLSSMGTANYMMRVNSGGTAWEYRSPSQVLGDIGALTSTIPGSGTELPYRLSSTAMGASGMYWDNTNARIGIGIASPGSTLTVYKSTSPAIALVNSTTGTASSDGGLITQNGSDLYIQNQEAAGSNVFVSVSSTQIPVVVALASAQSADAVQVKNSGGTVISAIDSSGGVRVGTAAVSADITGIVGSPRWTVAGNNAAHFNSITVATGDNSYGSRLEFFKTRDTDTDADVVVASGDAIMTLAGYGADGASYRSAAAIHFKVDGTPGSEDMPGSITFETSPDGAHGTVERMKISNDGVVTMGNTAGTPSLRADTSSTAGHTRLLIFDVDNGLLERVSVGSADSGGAGFKVLRIPN